LKPVVDAAVVVVAEPHELLGPFHRQPLQHRRADEREDRDVGAQSERQRHDGREREPGALGEAAGGKPDVVSD
jgi:hypothetical protein